MQEHSTIYSLRMNVIRTSNIGILKSILLKQTFYHIPPDSLTSPGQSAIVGQTGGGGEVADYAACTHSYCL
jgi:hypothetical protein